MSDSAERKSQSDKFKEAVCELETDTDEKRWEDRLKRIAKAKDVPVPPGPGPLREKPGHDESGA